LRYTFEVKRCRVVKNITFRNGKIRYSDRGNGRVVLLLHGFLESIEMWQYFNRKLEGYRRLICVDLPGHGGSDSYGYEHTMEFMAEAVKAVLNTEQIRKCIIVGHSMGGYVALAFGEKYPDYLHGLVLYYSHPFADSLAKKKDRDRAALLVSQNVQGFVRASIPMLFAEKYRTRYKRNIQTLIRRAEKMSAQGVAEALRGMKKRKDREIVMHFAPYPVMWVLGALDPIINIEEMELASQTCTNCIVKVLPQSGHMGFIEDKQQSLAAVRWFVNKIYGAPVR
jgi:pimeloyl-ACP methyl ester carboxylesterase